MIPAMSITPESVARRDLGCRKGSDMDPRTLITKRSSRHDRRVRTVARILVLAALFAVAAGTYLAIEVRSRVRRCRAAEEIEATPRAYVSYDYQYDSDGGMHPQSPPPGPKWGRKLFGEHFFATPVWAGFNSDEGIENLDYLLGLRKLTLTQETLPPPSEVTDAGLAHIRGLSRLEWLLLISDSVTDAGLKNIKGLCELEKMTLVCPRVTDAGLENLAGLVMLRKLELNYGDKQIISGVGLKNLRGLKALRELSLEHCPITDAAMPQLGALTGLEQLDLAETRVTDTGIRFLNGLIRLRKLYLYRTAITDSALEGLKQLSALEELSVSDTAVTRQGIARLQGALPRCKIFSD